MWGYTVKDETVVVLSLTLNIIGLHPTKIHDCFSGGCWKLWFVWGWLLWQAHRHFHEQNIYLPSDCEPHIDKCFKLGLSPSFFWEQLLFLSYFCVFRVVGICVALTDYRHMTFYRNNLKAVWVYRHGMFHIHCSSYRDLFKIKSCDRTLQLLYLWPILIRYKVYKASSCLHLNQNRREVCCSLAHMTKIHSHWCCCYRGKYLFWYKCDYIFLPEAFLSQFFS